MPNPLNPLDWLKSAQDWFSKTEKSSGFRPFLIFLLLEFGFTLCLLLWFPDSVVTRDFAVPALYISVCSFVLLYIIKAIQDPGFCRSEKHIETVKKMEMMEQKGDRGPVPIDITTKVTQNPHVGVLVQSVEKGAE